jgi:hypothetical protein
VNNQVKALGVLIYFVLLGLVAWAAHLISEATR